MVLEGFECPEVLRGFTFFAVPRMMAGSGYIQHFGGESETRGTDLLQVFLRISVLAQAVLKVLETLSHP